LFEHASLQGGTALYGLAADPDRAADLAIVFGLVDLVAQGVFHLNHHKVLPQRLSAAGTNTLFVAKGLVKHNVLGAGLDIDSAVHGQDADQCGIDFETVNHELFGARL